MGVWVNAGQVQRFSGVMLGMKDVIPLGLHAFIALQFVVYFSCDWATLMCCFAAQTQVYCALCIWFVLTSLACGKHHLPSAEILLNNRWLFFLVAPSFPDVWFSFCPCCLLVFIYCELLLQGARSGMTTKWSQNILIALLWLAVNSGSTWFDIKWRYFEWSMHFKYQYSNDHVN